jgi:hypothetical protein
MKVVVIIMRVLPGVAERVILVVMRVLLVVVL